MYVCPFVIELPTPSPWPSSGNADRNCQLNTPPLDSHALADIDSLVSAIAAGSGDLAFDITGDGMLDTMDLDAWLAEAGAANLGSGGSYLYGDANLDGSVDVSDFNTWNSNKFQTADSPAAVPEPTGPVLMLFGIAVIALYRRDPKRQ